MTVSIITYCWNRPFVGISPYWVSYCRGGVRVLFFLIPETERLESMLQYANSKTPMTCVCPWDWEQREI